jgi:hypothetical protein
MKRAVAVCALLFCTAQTVGGCRGRPTEAPPVTAPASTAAVELTTRQPIARIPQARLATATAIRLNVNVVHNPTNQGLLINLEVEGTRTPRRRAEIGAVSLYPNNQPGVFTVALSASAAALIQQGASVLVITVSPALAGVALSPGLSLGVTVAAMSR